MINLDDEEIQDGDGIITTYPQGSNTSLIKHFNGEKYPILLKN